MNIINDNWDDFVRDRLFLNRWGLSYNKTFRYLATIIDNEYATKFIRTTEKDISYEKYREYMEDRLSYLISPERFKELLIENRVYKNRDTYPSSKYTGYYDMVIISK